MNNHGTVYTCTEDSMYCIISRIDIYNYNMVSLASWYTASVLYIAYVLMYITDHYYIKIEIAKMPQ